MPIYIVFIPAPWEQCLVIFACSNSCQYAISHAAVGYVSK